MQRQVYGVGMIVALGMMALVIPGSGCRTAGPPEEAPEISFPSSHQGAEPAPPPPSELPPQPAPIAGKQIRSEDQTVALNLPAGWKPALDPSPPLLLKLVPGRRSEDLSPALFVVRTEVPGLPIPPPLDSLEAALRHSLPEPAAPQELQVEQTGRLRLGEQEALTLVATLTLGETSIREKQYYLYVGEHQYVLTGLAPTAQFERLEPLFDGVAASLEVR